MSNTIASVCEQYFEHLDEVEDRNSVSIKSNVKRFRTAFEEAQFTAQAFFCDIEARLEAFRSQNLGMPSSSYRAVRTHVVALVRWAFSERLVEFSPDESVRTGMPPNVVFATWTENPLALTAYKILMAEMILSKLRIEDLDEEYMAKFCASLGERMSDNKGGWREFTKRWRQLAAEGVVPFIDLTPLPSKKPQSYRLNREQIPANLLTEIDETFARFRVQPLRERTGRIPYDDSTIDLMMNVLLRLVGFLASEWSLDLSTTTLNNVLNIENAKRLISFTNKRHIQRHNRSIVETDQIGTYEIGQLLQLAAIVGGTGNDTLQQTYFQEIRYLQKKVQVRRENQKKHEHVESYLKVAYECAKKGLALLEKNCLSIRGAIYMRDAAIISLFAVFAPRISVLTNLDMNANVKVGTDGTILVCVPYEETKPSIRDQQLELAKELNGLWKSYFSARMLLLGNSCTSAVWIGQGGAALTIGAIAAAFKRRTKEFLGTEHNPHQARKALATDFSRWTNGDYLTLSPVMDASTRTIQLTYANPLKVERVRNFDAATNKFWKETESRRVA